MAGCQTIEVAGRTYRYALTGNPSADRAVVVDTGGPGAAHLGVSYPTDVLAKYAADEHALVLDEPWTTAQASHACDNALSAWYMRLRSQWPSVRQPEIDAALRRIVRECDVATGDGKWGFTSTTYRALVTGIAATHALTLSDFIGFSFASARWGYASDLFDQARLVSPFPIAMPARTYLAMKAASSRVDPTRP